MYAPRSSLTIVLSYLLLLILPFAHASNLFDSEFSLSKRQAIDTGNSVVGGVNGNICARVALQARVRVTAVLNTDLPIGQT